MAGAHILLRSIGVCTHRKLSPRRRLANTYFCIDMRTSASFVSTVRASYVRKAIDCTSVFQYIGRRVDIPSYLLRRMTKEVLDHLFRSFPAVSHVQLGLAGRGPPVKTSYRDTNIRLRTIQWAFVPHSGFRCDHAVIYEGRCNVTSNYFQ